MRIVQLVLVAPLILACAGCLEAFEPVQPTPWVAPWGDPDGGVEPDGSSPGPFACRAAPDSGTAHPDSASLPNQVSTPELDVLFVIDDSKSMAEEQAGLAEKFRAFIERLESLPGGLPSLHLGVVSSDLGTLAVIDKGCNTTGGLNGALQNRPRKVGCAKLEGHFISDVPGPDGSRVKNYQGSLDSAFSCIATLGTNGCGWEQHLGAMKRALDGTQPWNQGFLRKNAHLAVIIIADEDDCTARSSRLHKTTGAESPLSLRCFAEGVTCDPDQPYTDIGLRQQCRSNETSALMEPVGPYVDFLLALKDGNRDKVMVAAIIGKAAPVAVIINKDLQHSVAPSCQSTKGLAEPGIRLTQFVSKFGRHGAVASICSHDLSPALRQIGDLCASHMCPTP